MVTGYPKVSYSKTFFSANYKEKYYRRLFKMQCKTENMHVSENYPIVRPFNVNATAGNGCVIGRNPNVTGINPIARGGNYIATKINPIVKRKICLCKCFLRYCKSFYAWEGVVGEKALSVSPEVNLIPLFIYIPVGVYSH